ncbi:hypothetical protein KM043_017815 [Ampulex compressa]|nr:hypothetical protein KM043_017815 [Ampulex compressa]
MARDCVQYFFDVIRDIVPREQCSDPDETAVIGLFPGNGPVAEEYLISFLIEKNAVPSSPIETLSSLNMVNEDYAAISPANLQGLAFLLRLKCALFLNGCPLMNIEY